MSTLHCMSVEGGLLSKDGVSALVGAALYLLSYRQNIVRIVDRENNPRMTVYTDFAEKTIDVIRGTLFKAEIIEDGKTVQTEFIFQTAGPVPREYRNGWELSAMINQLTQKDLARN